MIIVWRGIGAFVLLIGILACLLVNFTTSAIFHENNYFQGHLWPKLVALWLSALSCWFLGRYVNSKRGRMSIDNVTGDEILEPGSHHFMFIKVEYWGVIFAVISVVVLIVGLTG